MVDKIGKVQFRFINHQYKEEGKQENIKAIRRKNDGKREENRYRRDKNNR